jgi:5'-nucleotidase
MRAPRSVISTRRLVGLGLVAALALGACGGDDESGDTTSPTTEPPATTTAESTTSAPAASTTTTSPATTTTTTAPAVPVQILVTNDDGVGAEGIDVLVEALLGLEGVEVTVVAPADQQSGTGGSTTDGPLTTTETTTVSGHPATAVNGFPADTVIWAVDQQGLDEQPDLVISGINEGQNLGPFVDLSGTVGAARAAATRGIPAIAVSQGLTAADGTPPDYTAGAEVVIEYLDEHLDDLLASAGEPQDVVVNINVPTCAAGTSIRGTAEVPAQIVVDDPAVALGPQDCSSTVDQPDGDVGAFVVGFVTISPIDSMPPREALQSRLAVELGDDEVAAEVSAGLGDDLVSTLAERTGGSLLTHPLLSMTPPTVDPADVDSLWILSFGYRFAPGVEPPADGAIPSPDDIVPGPVNEALARAAADFVAEWPVPIIAQSEVADALAELGVTDVISVGPDVAADGTVTYLSTVGAIDKGLRLAAEAGVDPGTAGILCFADHATRCQLVAQAAGLTAGVPDGVELPSEYDPESGQPWTRDRVSYLTTDLLGRTLLGT